MSETKAPICEVCNKPAEFTPEDDRRKGDLSGFECAKQPNHAKHLVAAKTYYHLGGKGVQSIRDRRMFSPTIVLVPAYDLKDSHTGQTITTRKVVVEFAQGGTYTTRDPEEQHYLDQKVALGYLVTGEAGLKEWDKVYLTPEQQVNKNQELLRLQEQQIEAGERKLRETNSLLDQAKAQTRGKQPATVNA